MTATVYKLFLHFFKLLPFKKQICLLIRFLKIPNEKFYKDLKFHGEFKVNVENIFFKLVNHKSTIENEIFWKGLEKNWEKDTIWLWAILAKEANVVFDIGANTGVYSLLTKALNPSSKVFAFEPSKNVYPKLLLNTEKNIFDINCYQIALSNFSGKQTFYDLADGLPTSATLSNKMENIKENGISYEVETLTLDDFLIQNKISSIDLIKIDVEMHEPEMMEGFQLIKTTRPIIFIEILTDEIAEKLNHILINQQYKYYELGFQKIIPLPSLKKGKPYLWNFLLVPEEKQEYLIRTITPMTKKE